MDSKKLLGRVIALPVETKVRELDGKVWLGYNLVRRGARIAIGDLSQIKNNINLIKPDIYIGDSAVYRASRFQLYRALKKAGTRVVVLDTEGGIYYSAEMYLKRLSPDILQYVDLVLSWGEATHKLFKQNRKNGHTQSRITGNPCFDLLMPILRGFFSEQAKYLKERYGDFFLVNTKFGRFNHFDSNLDHKKLLYDNPEIGRFQEELFGYFIDMVKEIGSQFQDMNVVVRPHPSENHDVYKQLFKGMDNIYIEHWWPVHSWALAAKGVIHNGCTTGIESRMLGKPVISYRPVQNSNVDVFIPNYISIEAFSQDELMRIVEGVASSCSSGQTSMDEKQIELLEKIFHKLDGFAARRVCEAIEALPTRPWGDYVRDEQYSPGPEKKITSFKRFNTIIRVILQKVKVGDKKRQEKYKKQKFSELTSGEIESILDRISRVENYQGKLLIRPITGMKNAFWLSHNN